MKKYRLDYYDMFDGWIEEDNKESANDFDDFDEVKNIRDKKNIELPEDNKKCGEHFGIINLYTGKEENCPLYDIRIKYLK